MPAGFGPNSTSLYDGSAPGPCSGWPSPSCSWTWNVMSLPGAYVPSARGGVTGWTSIAKPYANGGLSIWVTGIEYGLPGRSDQVSRSEAVVGASLKVRVGCLP